MDFDTDYIKENLESLDLNQQDQAGYTALMRAAEMDEYEIVEKLILKGADISLVNGKGQNALMLAITQSSINSALLLLEISPKTDINLQDHQGYTALMYAAIIGNLELVEKLVRAGAWIGETCKFNEGIHLSALDFAILNHDDGKEHGDIVLFLVVQDKSSHLLANQQVLLRTLIDQLYVQAYFANVQKKIIRELATEIAENSKLQKANSLLEQLFSYDLDTQFQTIRVLGNSLFKEYP